MMMAKLVSRTLDNQALLDGPIPKSSNTKLIPVSVESMSTSTLSTEAQSISPLVVDLVAQAKAQVAVVVVPVVVERDLPNITLNPINKENPIATQTIPIVVVRAESFPHLSNIMKAKKVVSTAMKAVNTVMKEVKMEMKEVKMVMKVVRMALKEVRTALKEVKMVMKEVKMVMKAVRT